MQRYRDKLRLPEQSEKTEPETIERPKAFDFSQEQESILEHECIKRPNGKEVCGICGADWPCPGGFAVKIQ